MRLPLPVVLASASPRRRELLARLVPEFEVVVAGVDEDALTEADPWRTAERLAQAKAEATLAQRPHALVIGGDTVVAVPSGHPFPEGLVYDQLAKPADPEDAQAMLHRLSDRPHAVITGVCLAWGDERRTFSDTSWVTFRPLDEEEIVAYVATGEPMDKAGAYAIQGGAAPFVAHLEGSHSNVVGLPLEALERALQELTIAG